MTSTGFSVIRTGDGSCSLYSEEYRELMHSKSGAYEEAVLKHVNPSGVLDLGRNVHVLDIGCGMGYNILALLAEARRRHFNGFLSIVSVEKDPGFRSLLDSVRFNDYRDDLYGAVREAMDGREVSTPWFSLRIDRGDARSLVSHYGDRVFNAVFHDPYSPGKNPELWTVDFFKSVFRVMRPDAILTTYSSALQIRRALVEAGFKIGKGPPVGKKREGTLAAGGGVIPLLEDFRIREIMLHPQGTPYRDEFLNGSREGILNRRLEEMRVRKGLQVR